MDENSNRITWPEKCFKRDVALCLERGALKLPLSAVRAQSPLGAGFSEKYYIPPLSTLGHRCFDVVALGKALFICIQTI